MFVTLLLMKDRWARFKQNNLLDQESSTLRPRGSQMVASCRWIATSGSIVYLIERNNLAELTPEFGRLIREGQLMSQVLSNLSRLVKTLTWAHLSSNNNLSGHLWKKREIKRSCQIKFLDLSSSSNINSKYSNGTWWCMKCGSKWLNKNKVLRKNQD